MTNRHDIDDLFDELQSAVNVEPSPAFETRVRQRVSTVVASTTRWWWMGTAAAVAATAVVVTMVMPRSSADLDDGVDVVRLRGDSGQAAPAERAAAPVAEAAVEAMAAPDAASLSRSKKARSVRTLPAAVQTEQERALGQLVAAMWSGQVRTVPRIGGEPGQLEIGALDAPEPIQLSTIRIDPLYEEF